MFAKLLSSLGIISFREAPGHAATTYESTVTKMSRSSRSAGLPDKVPWELTGWEERGNFQNEGNKILYNPKQMETSEQLWYL